MSSINSKITIIGLGYIGLPTYLLLCEKLNNVYGYDTDEKKIENLKKGKFFFNEVKIQNLYKKIFKKKKIDIGSNFREADIYIFTVQTPIKKNNKPELRYLFNGIDKIIPFLKKNDLIIVESTSPVGTIQKIIEFIKSKRKELFINKEPIFHISYCPERLLPGNTLKELKNNVRIIGGYTLMASKMSREVYKVISNSKYLLSDSRTAELCKLAENTFRDINIAYANFLKIYCEENNINVKELIKLANQHPRVNILQPGIGVGGHCIPIDPLFLISAKNQKPHESLIKNSRLINDSMPIYSYNQIKKRFHDYKNTRLTILGITYKPNTDDYRNSPAIEIAIKLNKLGFKCINFCDPNIDNNILRKYNINQINLKNLRENSDVILKLVNHKEFKDLKFKKKEIKFIDFSI